MSKWLFRLQMPNMPRFEQTIGFNLFISNLSQCVKILDSFSTKDFWNVSIEWSGINTELNMIIEDALKMQQWSHRINFNTHISARPITNKILEETDYMPYKPTYPTITFGSKNDQDIFFRQLDVGKLINIPIKSSIIPDELMRRFLWKEHYAFYDDGEAILWVQPDAIVDNFHKALYAKLFDYEEMWKRDLKKDYKKLFYEREYCFLGGAMFIKFMKITVDGLMRINKPDLNLEYMNHLIEHYKLDKQSEIVMEFPNLERIIGSVIYKYQLCERSVYYEFLFAAETIIMINEMSQRNMTVSSSYDPYGIRSKIKKLSEWSICWLDLVHEGKLKTWIETRVESKLNPTIRNLKCSLNEKYKNRFMTIDQSILKRLVNLTKEEPTDSKQMDKYEYELLASINKALVHNIPELLHKLEEYINEYKIMPYKERHYIIKSFLDKFFIK